jgi:hypothetical protein
VRAVSSPPAARLAGFAIAAVLATGCSRDALTAECPALAPGELVVSELRGPQGNDDDAYGEWLEVFNASGAALDLAGLRVDVRKLDGSGDERFLVRDATELADGGYAVLGRFDQAARPEHVDYGYLADLDAGLYATAAIDLSSCGELIDRVVYHGLTDFGSLALDGGAAPDAATNDDEAAFCVDDRLDDADPSAGARGTPGGPNPPCE